ncbi:MAG: iron ABC transporter permease [Phreatobacter sp.]|nr:iron ABC transporter permease [Phreatobacter sp.]
MVGPVWLPPFDVLYALAGGDTTAGIIVHDIRLPRTILALMIGATLGLAGAALQGLVRNPLAEPTLFGAPAAAAFASAAMLAFGGASVLSFWMPTAGMAGAFVSVAALFLVAGNRAGVTILLLAGLALNSLFGAATALVLNLAPNPFAALEIAFWLLGSLEDRSFVHVALAGPFMVAGAVLLVSQARAYRALTLGEEVAASLGANVARARLVVAMGLALGVGAAVSVTGAIGFVGLVAPHLVRRSVGSDPARILLPAALAGAALLTAADIVARLIPATTEIKTGVVTALVGVPFFLWRILKSRRSEEDA